MAGRNPIDDGYVEVSERITKFYEIYPNGSLRCKAIYPLEINGAHFLVYIAQAYRTPDDPAPAEGVAWEPVPGQTNFTRDSEAMNAETSAWGRAIAALGFEVQRGIASANEVRNRQNGESQGKVAPSDKQIDFLVRLAKDGGADSTDQEKIRAYGRENLTGGKAGSMSKVIDSLKGNDPGPDLLKLTQAAHKWDVPKEDAPADREGLEQQPLDEDAQVPF